MQKRQFEPVGQVTGAFQFAKEILHETAFGNDHNHCSQFAGGLRDHLEAPDDLVDRQRRKLFQLQFHHGTQFFRLAFRQVNYAEENLFSR